MASDWRSLTVGSLKVADEWLHSEPMANLTPVPHRMLGHDDTAGPGMGVPRVAWVDPSMYQGMYGARASIRMGQGQY